MATRTRRLGSLKRRNYETEGGRHPVLCLKRVHLRGKVPSRHPRELFGVTSLSFVKFFVFGLCAIGSTVYEGFDESRW